MAEEDVLQPGEQEEHDHDHDHDHEEGELNIAQKLKEAIEVNVEDMGTLRKKVVIKVPRETINERVDEQYGELRREAAVPGFRKGRAPRRLLEKRFGGEVTQTLIQQLVSSGYLAAIDKSELKVIGDPLIWIKGEGEEGERLVEIQEAIERIKLPDDGPLEFAAEVEVRPEFSLPSLEGIPVKKPVVTVSEEDIDNQLERFRQSYGHWEPVVDGEVQPDDYLTAAVKITCEGQTLREEDNVRLAARPGRIDGIEIANLGDVLKGAKLNDTRTATGQVPDDYPKAEARGKEAQLEFTIRDINRFHAPELTDEFIRNMGFETRDDLRKWMRSELESRIGEEIHRGMQAQVAQYLLDNTPFELPERLSNRQINQVVMRRMIDLYDQGLPEAEVAKQMDSLRTGAREEAIRDMKMAFIMNKLADEVEVEVAEGEINAHIAAIARRQNRRFDKVRDQLEKEGAIDTLYYRIRERKILDKLLEKAAVTEEQAPPREGQSDAT